MGLPEPRELEQWLDGVRDRLRDGEDTDAVDAGPRVPRGRPLLLPLGLRAGQARSVARAGHSVRHRSGASAPVRARRRSPAGSTATSASWPSSPARSRTMSCVRRFVRNCTRRTTPPRDGPFTRCAASVAPGSRPRTSKRRTSSCSWTSGGRHGRRRASPASPTGSGRRSGKRSSGRSLAITVRTVRERSTWSRRPTVED